MRMKRLLRAITLTTPPMSYDLVKKSLHIVIYKSEFNVYERGTISFRRKQMK